MNAYKFLARGRRGRFSGFVWPVGAWVLANGQVEECRSGVHACTGDQLVDWLDDELWEIELGGEVEMGEAGVVASRGRLVRRVAAWDAAAARAFADACVASANELVESARPASVEGARELAVLAADCVVLGAGARPDEARGLEAAATPAPSAIAANIGFVVAHVAGRAAVVEGRDYEQGFADERSRQRRFLHDLIAERAKV